jgi:DNA repair exonuclease SbcCD nuclease subunit
MGRLSKAGIRVFIVSGNHDAASRTTRAMPLPDNVTLFSSDKPASVKLDDLGVMIHGQSYAHRAVSDNLALQYPQRDANCFNIGMLHTSLAGRRGHEDYAPCTRDDLASKGYDYWALGHVHRREVVSRDPWMVFPGNIQGRHIRERGAKGATVVTIEDGRVATVETRELDVLRWAICRVDLSGCGSSDSVYDAVRQAFEKELDLADGRTLALRLVLTGRSLVHGQLHRSTARWTEEFRGIAAAFGNLWLEKVNFQTRRPVNLADALSGDTPVAGLLRSIQQSALDGHTLLDLVPELAALNSKLPVEVYGGDHPFADSSSDKIAELHTQAKELLVAKLLGHGESG